MDPKIDCLMWTLNSAKTLPRTLQSIKKTIPSHQIGQKIIVDGHSTDETKTIAKKMGWTVIDAENVGIPYQANQGLKLVNTEFFASFEHDVILNPNWFQTVMKHMQADPKVAVVQGARLTTNAVFKEIEQISLERVSRYTSIDNNLYRTEIIRSLGGFDINFPISADRNLQDRLQEAGYKWIVDKTLISDHIRQGIRQNAKHCYELSNFSDYHEIPSMTSVLTRFMFSPFRSIDIAIKKSCPQTILVYPYWRLMLIKSAINMRARKTQNE